ncbi:MAG: hypothetical protein M5U01_15535 [Ardenticatenaceae bacterium]|nr:hypothetical protein [Ardenticatenaceae bacterium]
MTENDLRTNPPGGVRRRFLRIVLGALVVILALAGWQYRAVAAVVEDWLPGSGYQESPAMRTVKSNPQGTLQTIWEPTILEPSRSLQKFTRTEGFRLLYLTIDSTNPDVAFKVYIDDPQRYG